MSSQPEFTVVSTFSGCGGSSLGYKLAGGDVRLAVEWDDNAVETYRLNFPDTPIFHGDIADLSVKQACEMAQMEPRELDILDGSPPCQGFSTAGKRIMQDTRNQLFREYARLLEGLQPKVFIMENVSGMVKGKMKLVFAEILRTLKACGYKVSARLLNAMYFNVPQSRQRMIFIGVREDLGLTPSHPQPIGRCTIRRGLTGIKNSDLDIQEASLKPTWSAYRVLRGVEAHKHHSLVITDWNKPSGTILSSQIDGTTNGLIHPDRKRRFTISELQRLQTFPDEFLFIGSFIDRWRRIGNSVPPNFMRAIAEHVRDEILAKVPASTHA